MVKPKDPRLIDKIDLPGACFPAGIIAFLFENPGCISYN